MVQQKVVSGCRERATVLGVALLTMLASVPAVAGVSVSFSKVFQPDVIGPGSTSTLVFDIVNTNQVTPVTDLAFSDTLPAGVVIATPASASTSCGAALLTAPGGGTTISMSDGSVGAGSSCDVRVNVTSSTPGTHTNVSGDLTSSAGNSGSATDDLTVDTGRPGFLKSFAPSAVPLGGRSTLAFVIDNTANAAARANLTFLDPLPGGMVVAGPTQAATTCTGGAVTATPGGNVVSYGPQFPGDAAVAAGSSCTVSVDVVAGGAGLLANLTSELTSSPLGGGPVSSGRATAGIDVTADPLALSKSFTDDPVPAGGTVTLEFTILNLDRNFGATNVTFTDDLDAALSGLVAVGLPASDVCGTGSQLTGTNLLTLTGGNLAPEASCTFSVDLVVPAGASSGAYLNTTGQITGEVDGSPVNGSAASDLLFVQPAPLLTKEFTDDPVGGGGTVTLEFTLTNTSTAFSLTGATFQDVFIDELQTAASVPPNGFCGAGSTAIFTPPTVSFPAMLTVVGANLPAGGSCTFSIVLNVIDGAASGDHPNVTSNVTGVVDGAPVTGNPATDVLTIVGAPQLTKEFIDDPVQPGDTVTLELTILHDENATGDATDITFTDDLDAALAGLAATGLPANDVCGIGSQISGTSVLTLTGGTLAPGESCTFDVALDVPMGATSGAHTNTTSALEADVDGVPTVGNGASDDLMIAGLTLTKEFTDDPVVPGGTVTLEFTVQNVTTAESATGIFFQDDLDNVLSGLVGTGLPLVDPCGTGSSLDGLSGNTLLRLTGGSLGPGESCVFSVTLQVPAGAASDTYVNRTSSFLATIGGQTIPFENASDALVVSSDLLMLTKSFTDDPVAPGGTVTLEFTLTNLDAAEGASSIAFTDDLDAALSGLAAVGLPMNDVCGTGSQISGTSLLTFTGGNLPAGGACTWSVTLMVPAAVPLGSTVTNLTSSVTGMLGGLAITGDPATDDLLIQFLTFSKSFDGPTVAGGTPVLTFTIENASTTDGATGISFTDDLDATLAGLVATGLPASDVCGEGSTLAGTSFLTLAGGNLGPSGSCSFDVTLQVPAAAAAGDYLNTTSSLLVSGLEAAPAAEATLTIEPPPTFAKSFAPDSIPAGGLSTLVFTIDNTASVLAASALDFTDNMPAALMVASPNGASTTCTGGTVTAAPGGSVITYTGGSVAAGASCTVQADVTSATLGIHLNTSGDLTSSSGNSGTASDPLEVFDGTPPTVTLVNSFLDTGDGQLEECETARTQIHSLLVSFDEAMFDPGNPSDPNAVTNPDNWQVVGSGPDQDLSTSACGPPQDDDVDVTVDQVVYDGGSFIARVDLNGPAALDDAPYRLFACSGGGLVDEAGNELDGDGNGTGGDDFVRTFRVDRLDAFANGNFDCTLDGWVTSEDPQGSAIQHTTDDVNDAGISGSAGFDNPMGNNDLALGQCVRVAPSSTYELSGFVRLNSSGVTLQVIRTCQMFSSDDCSGTGLPPQGFITNITSQGVWEPFVNQVQTPPGVGSAVCQITLRNAAGDTYTANADDLSLAGDGGIFADGFESGDTSAWTSTVE